MYFLLLTAFPFMDFVKLFVSSSAQESRMRYDRDFFGMKHLHFFLQILRLLNVTTLSAFPKKKDKQRILHTFMRVLIVQHPFTHLIQLHSKINQRFVDRGQPAISFQEFAQFVVDGNRTMVQELSTMRQLSQACRLNYHVILRTETFAEDLVPLIYMLNPRGKIIDMKANLLSYMTKEDTAETLSLISLHKDYDTLSVNEIKGLLNMYKDDMKMFGYSLNATASGMLAICQYNKINCC